MKISPQEISVRLENFRKTSRDKRLPLTPQKSAIFQAIATSCEHPGVTEIYKQLKSEFPSISLATVYKNLKKFENLGLLVEIPVPGKAPRYDAKLEIHSHAVDTASGCVYDVETPKNLSLPKEILGKKVKHANLIYYL
ncbi:MAG: transcriptional repressor [Candidatus Falkowbacteria bacterium]|nr:transcriptional repressor [Candidatus Falkowbacteria bacterium]